MLADSGFQSGLLIGAVPAIAALIGTIWTTRSKKPIDHATADLTTQQVEDLKDAGYERLIATLTAQLDRAASMQQTMAQELSVVLDKVRRIPQLDDQVTRLTNHVGVLVAQLVEHGIVPTAALPSTWEK